MEARSDSEVQVVRCSTSLPILVQNASCKSCVALIDRASRTGKRVLCCVAVCRGVCVRCGVGRVRGENVCTFKTSSVCAFKTSPCVPAPRPHV